MKNPVVRPSITVAMMPLYDQGLADGAALLTKLAALPGASRIGKVVGPALTEMASALRGAAPTLESNIATRGISLGKPVRDPVRMAKLQKYIQYRGARGEISQITPQMFGRMSPGMQEHYMGMARQHPKLNRRMFDIADQSALPQVGGSRMSVGANPLAKSPAPAQSFTSLNDELSAFGKGASFSGDTDMQKTAFDLGVEQAMADFGLVKVANGMPPEAAGGAPELGDAELEQLVSQMSPEELEQLLGSMPQEELGQVGAGMDPQQLEALLSQLSPEELHQLMAELEGQGGGMEQGGGMPPEMAGAEGGEAEGGEGGGNPFGGGKAPKKEKSEKKEEKGEKKEKKEPKEDEGGEKEAGVKVANPLAGLMSRLPGSGNLLGKFLSKSTGTAGRSAIGAGLGATAGGIGGAMGADEGQGGRGFLRGALAGGTVGGLAGGLGGAGLKSHFRNVAQTARPAGAGFLAPSEMSSMRGVISNNMRQGSNKLLGQAAGGLGLTALGTGMMAGSTAQQSPMDKLKSRLGGMMG